LKTKLYLNCTIIDTTNTPHSNVGKFLANLLAPLTHNEYTVKDSFEAAQRIHEINTHYFDQGYVFVSFDVESLFTNVPLKKTVDLILDRIYNKNLISTSLSKRSLKKLILDSCNKTAFSFNNNLYEQFDGVSMGSSLGPVLANIIMTELENKVISKLVSDNTIKFYIRYVDDTLVLVKRSDVDKVMCRLNSFHKNLNFTVDSFPDHKIHFLDLLINKNITDLYYKDTHTGQYTSFSSFTPWRLKTAWVKALYSRAYKICSNCKLFNNQVRRIDKFLSWNNFPKRVRRSILNRLRKNTNNPKRTNKLMEDNGAKTIWLKLPYAGKTGEGLVNKFVKKLNRLLGKKVKFIIRYDTTKISHFCSNKDPVPTLQKSSVIYKLSCPGCSQQYIGKTDRSLAFRLHEHATKPEQPMYHHLANCNGFIELVSFHGLPDCLNDHPTPCVSFKDHILNAVYNNFEIIDYNYNWSQLAFLEAFHIKNLKPSINDGLKASRELELFL
jgi:hypothetical protein